MNMNAQKRRKGNQAAVRVQQYDGQEYMVRAQKLPRKADSKVRAQSAYKGERMQVAAASRGSSNLNKSSYPILKSRRPQSGNPYKVGFSGLRFSNVTTDAGGVQQKAAVRPSSHKSGRSTNILNQSCSWATRKSHRTKPESKDNLQIDSFLGGLGRLGSTNNRKLVRP